MSYDENRISDQIDAGLAQEAEWQEKVDKLLCKPCPICGQVVNKYLRLSPDRTIQFVELMHGPLNDCGIRYRADLQEMPDKWNNRKFAI